MQQEQMKLNIKFEDTTSILCPECQNDSFIAAFLMRKIPALLAPEGIETMWPIQIFECSQCGAKLPETMPNDN